jgi:hypothetical protein
MWWYMLVIPKGRRTVTSSSAWAELARPYFKIKPKQKGWEHGSSGRVLA